MSATSQDAKTEILITASNKKAINRTNLYLTYSCYKGGEQHCGKCGTCQERIEAFKLAGVKDPTEYKD